MIDIYRYRYMIDIYRYISSSSYIPIKKHYILKAEQGFLDGVYT